MRIKRGVSKKQKHKKVLALTKGYRLSYHKLYRRAQEALAHAGNYSMNDRRKRGANFRELWIKRISAGLNGTGLKYSEFINKLNKAKINLNRKVLASLALDHPDAFKAVVEAVK